MQARYVEERRRSVTTDTPHSQLLLDKPSLLLHPTPGADAPNTELIVNEGGQFEQKPAENAFGKGGKISKKKTKASQPFQHGRAYAECIAPPSQLCGGYGGGFGRSRHATRGGGSMEVGYADLQFAGPALVLPEVPVQEDGTVNVPNENLPEGWNDSASLGTFANLLYSSFLQMHAFYFLQLASSC